MTTLTLKEYIGDLYSAVQKFEEQMLEEVSYDKDVKDIGEWDSLFQEFFCQYIEDI